MFYSIDAKFFLIEEASKAIQSKDSGTVADVTIALKNGTEFYAINSIKVTSNRIAVEIEYNMVDQIENRKQQKRKAFIPLDEISHISLKVFG